MTEVWTCGVTEGGPEGALHSLLSAEEQRRYAAFYFARHRREFLYAHAVKRLALSRYAGVAPSDWEFAVGEWGKPRVAGEAALEFNLSHTAGLVACAVSDEGGVGVDVERVDREVDAVTIASRFFAPEEFRQIEGREEGSARDAFFRIWTLKEAYVKAVGRGFNLPLSEFWFVFGENGEVQGPPGWRFSEFAINGKYRMAVAGGAGAPVVRDARELIREYESDHEDGDSRGG